MKKEIIYEEDPWADDPPINLRPIADFLPSPAELAQSEKNTKITLSISSDSLRFFKREAAKHNVPYQAMIRRLLDEYRTKI
jgi:predicted DNA binding CopG/RHH family protein